MRKNDIASFKRSKVLKHGDVIYTSPTKGEIKAESRGKATLKDGVITLKVEHLREVEYKVEPRTEVIVKNGDNVLPGTPLTKGALNPKNLVDTAGLKVTQKYLIENIQETYSNQGIALNDKHTEAVVRQMSRYVRILNPGDSEYAVGDFISRLKIERENVKLKKESKEPIIHKDKLLGITMSSLKTESWLSATSFERQVAVLTDAAIQGKTDHLRGLKENVIIGRLIPVRDLVNKPEKRTE